MTRFWISDFRDCVQVEHEQIRLCFIECFKPFQLKSILQQNSKSTDGKISVLKAEVEHALKVYSSLSLVIFWCGDWFLFCWKRHNFTPNSIRGQKRFVLYNTSTNNQASVPGRYCFKPCFRFLTLAASLSWIVMRIWWIRIVDSREGASAATAGDGGSV